MRVRVFTGDITEAPADVVCSSTNPMLEISMGIGAALVDAGGEAIREHCEELIRNEKRYMGRHYFPVGTCHWTTAGTLPFNGIIHCVAIDPFSDSTVNIIRKCTEHAMRLAGIRECASIALPVFAVGNGRYYFDESLEEMMNVLLNFTEDLPEEVVILARPDWAFAAQRIIDRYFYSAQQLPEGAEKRPAPAPPPAKAAPLLEGVAQEAENKIDTLFDWDEEPSPIEMDRLKREARQPVKPEPEDELDLPEDFDDELDLPEDFD